MMRNNRVLYLGGRYDILGKAAAAGLSVVNVQKPHDHDPAVADHCRSVHVLDYQDIPQITALAEELHAQEPFARVLSQTEGAQLVVGYLTSRLALPGNPYSVARTLHDKRTLRALLNARQLGPVAMRPGRTRQDIEDFLAAHGRCVVKPALGSGSLGVFLVPHADAVAETWERISAFGLDDFMIEELLVGTEISVESFSAAGRHRVVACTAKDTGGGVVELGHSVPAEVSPEQHRQIDQLVCAALDAVGFVDGPAHTEVMLTRDGPRIIEAHCRRAGDRITDLVELVHGVDLERLVFEQVGRPTALPEPQPAHGSAAIRFLTAEPGRVTAVTGVDRARAAEGVRAVKIQVEAGSTVDRLAWSKNRCGHVIAYSPRPDEASRLARQAADLITVHTDGTAGHQPPTMAEILHDASEILDPFAELPASALPDAELPDAELPDGDGRSAAVPGRERR